MEAEYPFGYRLAFPERSTSRLISMYGALPAPTDTAYGQFDKLLWLMIGLGRDNPGSPITLVIDSPGGDARTLEVFLDHIKLLPFPVRMVARNVHSAAAFLFTAGAKGDRYVFAHSQIMFHMFHQARALNERHDQLNHRLARLLSECTDGKILHLLGPDDLDNKSDEEKRVAATLSLLKSTILLDANGAVRYGVADHIIDESAFHDLFLR